MARTNVPPEQLVATVNGAPISKLDVELRLQELKAAVEGAGETWKPLPPTAPEGEASLAALVEDLVTGELASQDAASRGLAREPELQQRWNFLRRSFFSQAWLDWQTRREQATEDEVAKYYQEYQQAFRDPERLRLRQLTIASEDQAKQAVAQLLSGMDVAALARQISSGPTAANGGLLKEWVLRANDKALYAAEDPQTISLDPSLEAAAFAIDQPNRISSYVKGPDGQFHVFQLVEKRAAREKPLAEVHDDIQAALNLDKLNRTLEGLRTKATVQQFPERLQGISQ